MSDDANENKFLSFRLADEEYGVEILRVREIIGVQDITPLPQTPAFVRGVINLRGKIIAVIELRRKFRLPEQAFTEQTCIIVCEVADGPSGERTEIGVIVDSVSEVLDIPRTQIEPTPRFGNSVNTDFILGMGKVKDQVLILLDIDRVLASGELTQITSATDAAGGRPETLPAAA